MQQKVAKSQKAVSDVKCNGAENMQMRTPLASSPCKPLA